jgi:hypothetical protein
MRMRISLHAGEVSYDGRNWVGTELNTACRLVDVPELRANLLASPHAQLAICVSDLWFRAVVRHDPGLIDHRTYTPITVVAKELSDTAWLHVPDLAVPGEAINGHQNLHLVPREDAPKSTSRP